MSRNKTEDWIDAYAVGRVLSYEEADKDPLSYVIPSYKVNRLINIEKENEELKKKIESALNMIEDHIMAFGDNNTGSLKSALRILKEKNE